MGNTYDLKYELEIISNFERLGYLTEKECMFLSSRTQPYKVKAVLDDYYKFDDESRIATLGTFEIVDTYAVYDRERIDYSEIIDIITKIASDPKQLE